MRICANFDRKSLEFVIHRILSPFAQDALNQITAREGLPELLRLTSKFTYR